MTRVQVFIDSLRTRRTNTTQGLEIHLANDPGGEHHPLFETPNHLRMQAGGALSSGPAGRLPWWAKQALIASGLHVGEIEHISDWPAAQRDMVREAILKAVEENTAIEFFWELIDGENNVTAIQDSDPIVVTFKSPRVNVRYQGSDDVAVDV